MANLERYAERELESMENREMAEALMQAVRVFCKEGHSGASAPYMIHYYSKALRHILFFKPLTPLTGEEEEWDYEIASPDKAQNKRCFSVFKDTTTGFVTDHDAYVFYNRDEPKEFFSGGGYNQRMDKMIGSIAFPYMPNQDKIEVCVEDFDELTEKEFKEKYNIGGDK